jgi:HPt (histidine-containing phosphotransfer) domain-containing protein
MELAIALADPTALREAAHALKGAAGNVGAVALARAAAELEDRSAGAFPTDAAHHAAGLQQLWDRTRPALAAWS